MSHYTEAKIASVYAGSNGDATKALYAELQKLGPVGEVAVNVFRAHKTSGRAKDYRGGIRGQGSYKSMAYDRKNWSMANLCQIMAAHGQELGIAWGWGVDKEQLGRGSPHHHVLYIELPTGQVSFHAEYRGQGPDFPGEWDGVKGEGPTRISRWLAALLSKVEAA